MGVAHSSAQSNGANGSAVDPAALGRVQSLKSTASIATTTTAYTSTSASAASSLKSRLSAAAADRVNEGLSPTATAGKYIALDCEMVGIGPNPNHNSALARASLVNYHGTQLYDSYVLPKEPVTDYRTHVSGIRPADMVHARTFEQVQSDIARLLLGNVLVGHAIRNDLDVLKLGHPRRDIRDTARHKPFRELMATGGGSPRLKDLASRVLGWDIQGGEHSSVEDARACMALFRTEREAFEREHVKRWPVQVVKVKVKEKDGEAGGDEEGKQKGRKKKTKKQKKKKRK